MNKLEKLEEQYKKLGEEIQALKKEDEFVPGWYIMWDNGVPNQFHIEYWEQPINVRGMYMFCEPVTQELLNRFLPKQTRYDWKAILEKYPNAKYATTDEDGRVDLWRTMPEVDKWAHKWLGLETNPLTIYRNVGKTPDWEDSLEERPENI